MFKKILVPIDLTDAHEQAVAIAAQLAKQGNGEVTLVHAVELIHGLSLEEDRPFYDRLERKARAHLNRFAGRLTEQQVPAHMAVLYGNRVEEILRYAAQQNIDLIVLTSHRLDPAHPEMGWGTLSHRIGILSPCPVLLVK